MIYTSKKFKFIIIRIKFICSRVHLHNRAHFKPSPASKWRSEVRPTPLVVKSAEKRRRVVCSCDVVAPEVVGVAGTKRHAYPRALHVAVNH